MRSDERVKCALAHREADTVPILEFVYSRKFFKEVVGTVPEGYTAEYIMKCAQRVGYDAVVIPFGGYSSFEYNKAERYQDEWGTTYQKEENAWPSDAPVDFPVKTPEDWKNYAMPDSSIPSRTDGIKTAIRMNADSHKFIIGNVRGPFSGGWLLTGFLEMCIDMYEHPDMIHSILAKVADFSIAGGLRLLDEGADALLIADDYGSNTAPFMSPDQFRAFVLPEVSRMLDSFHRRGAKVIMHSDGQITPFLPFLTEKGIDGYHPLERAAGMDIAGLKEQYGKKLVLIGNVNNKTTLVTGSVQDVENEVKECIRAAAKGGGYILASDHSVHDDIPNENIFALYEAGRKYGKYPITL